ncbi:MULTISPECIES: hypothetical protein [Cytobacillus]|uniref:Uncharacterized protein n=1 Tax=Cytobacillus stercorigallinarum TaxID=2762240 RepID=A0ABR8QVN5_9BACI|nr:hypothetical protein [Cytobacillus stercorigallinarum]MBD7939563.1 hypothetical protein [Cytobacillus stercorigallinarum]
MIKKIVSLIGVAVLSLTLVSGINSVHAQAEETGSTCIDESSLNIQSEHGNEYYEVSFETADCLQAEAVKNAGKSVEKAKKVLDMRSDGSETEDTLLEVFQSESTGVRGEVRAVNAEEAIIAKEEVGYPDKVTKVKIIKDKDASLETHKHPGNENLEKFENESLLPNPTIKPFGKDTSGWDLVGTEYWKINFSWQTDTVWHSHGGNYSVLIPKHNNFKNETVIRLYDHDPNFNKDEFIGTKTVTTSTKVATRVTWSGLNNYIDGDNKLVETYTMHYNYYVLGENLQNVRYYD